ncbi:MAG TPA: glycosyltransferase family 2 protein [Candidatus Aquilonibacter sp.]|jgi:glycosyltransferase involved in cell wall biosynthesis|nr:glycosyltransferase family 2 protein [Candidatus Aquilonibacter sp.]
MEKVEDLVMSVSGASAGIIPVSVVIAARNEAKNLPRCLQALRDAGEIYVIDSQSSDDTVEIARSLGAKVVQFHYQGGWPKKRQWAMETLPLAYDWILLLDADEVLTPELAKEIRSAIQNHAMDGYSIQLRTWFLGRALHHGDVGLWKLALFRRGKGRFECRLKEQDASMADMEVHEHVVVEGATAKLRNPLTHHNVESLSHYIRKHDEYSNWEARVLLQRENDRGLPASLFGTQAQRRRWLKLKLFAVPGSPVLLFLYRYVLRLGFLDGVPGLIYCSFQAVQMFHTKAKIYELKHKRMGS